MRSQLRKALLAIAVVATGGLLAVAALLTSLWVERRAELELPPPTGPFAVGRITTAWVDTSRADPYASAPAPKRELVVWLWYPATRIAGSRSADYLPKHWAETLASHTGASLLDLMWRDPAKVRAHSLDHPPVVQNGPPFPLVIFRSGIGANALDYSTLAEDLASHGYIVVGADAPYSTRVVVMPDGRVIEGSLEGNPGDALIPESERNRLLDALLEVWAADTRFLLDRVALLNDGRDPTGAFTGRLDLHAVGIAGHSFGGATAAQVCHDDTRCRAGVDNDGALHGSVVAEGIRQPFMFLLSDHGEALAPPDSAIFADIRRAAWEAPSDKLIVTLVDADHFSFGDQALTFSPIVRSIVTKISGQGGLDARVGLAFTSRYLSAFFDVYLRGAPREALSTAPLMAGARLEAR